MILSPSERGSGPYRPPAPSRPSRMSFLCPISRSPHTGPGRVPHPPFGATFRRAAPCDYVLNRLDLQLSLLSRDRLLRETLPALYKLPPGMPSSEYICAPDMESHNVRPAQSALGSGTVLGGNSYPMSGACANGRLAADMLPPSCPVLHSLLCLNAG